MDSSGCRVAGRGPEFGCDRLVVTCAGTSTWEIAMDLYERLGVRKIVNAQGNVTRIGGSIMPPEVLEAMAEASRSYVSIDELNARIGERIAELLDVEAAYVCSGAAGGLMLAAAACMAGSDPEKIVALPDTHGMPNEIVAQRFHRSPYNQSMLAAGAKIVEVGGDRGATAAEMSKAIGPKTAAVFFSVLPLPGIWEVGLSLEEVVEIAHARGKPVIVDASATLPPLEHLRRFPGTGADLVAFSGGKALEGPQPTGILCGRRDLIRAAALNSNPNHAIGRPMKVGKEEMAGLLAAVELYFKRDHQADRRRWEAMCTHVARELEGVAGITAEARFWEARGVPATFLTVDEGKLGMGPEEICRRLREGDPPVCLWYLYGEFTVVPNTLREGEEKIVARALKAVLAGKREQVPA